jgi:hypothetical protein
MPNIGDTGPNIGDNKQPVLKDGALPPHAKAGGGSAPSLFVYVLASLH